MAVQAIDNANLLALCNNCGAVGFLPVVGYVFDAEAKTVVVTNSSTIPAGDTFGKVKIRIMDKFGGEKRAVITVAGTPNTVDVSTLNLAKGLNLMVTVLTPGRIAADGIAVDLMAAGNVSQWDIQKNA